jgi:hypothetical protein
MTHELEMPRPLVRIVGGYAGIPFLPFSLHLNDAECITSGALWYTHREGTLHRDIGHPNIQHGDTRDVFKMESQYAYQTLYYYGIASEVEGGGPWYHVLYKHRYWSLEMSGDLVRLPCRQREETADHDPNRHDDAERPPPMVLTLGVRSERYRAEIRREPARIQPVPIDPDLFCSLYHTERPKLLLGYVRLAADQQTVKRIVWFIDRFALSL